MTRVDAHDPLPVGSEVEWPVYVTPFIRKNGGVGYDLRYANGHTNLGIEF